MRLIRKMDIHIHDRCILRGEDHHRPYNGVEFQNLMLDTWVDAGGRASLGDGTVVSEGKEACGECEW